MFEKVRADKAQRTMKDRYQELYFAAESVRANSYSPYSDFSVGAALLVRPNEDSPLPMNKKYFGVNIENGSYGATLCAERAAFAAAITDGVLKYETGENPFIAIAVSAGDEEAVPCGICRQFMYEFSPGLTVITGSSTEDLTSMSLSQLMPEGFTL